MDKNAIKKYAVWARRELIEKVSQKALQYGIEEGKELDPKLESINGVLLSDVEKKQRQALINKINEFGYTQVMEEVAYTWFNRFIALRFMEVNGYLPSHVRVFTDENNDFKPQILSEALHIELDNLDKEKVMEMKQDNQDDELYKYLLLVQCNDLNSILPAMFPKIADYTELLLPDYLLREGSVLEQLITNIEEKDWLDQVQIIGWLYQFYNSEPKDAVFSALKKNVKISKENIPAATQLFTPDWIVRYMVQNSLGRFWLNNGNDKEFEDWAYYVKNEEDICDVNANIKPEDLLCIDPCMGSGHILVYMFDVLIQIYESYGYSPRESAEKIISNNIRGLDIDKRASQLAYFSLMMKARQYDRRFFSKKVFPKVYDFQGLKYEWERTDDEELNALIDRFNNAEDYGSLIETDDLNIEQLKAKIDGIEENIISFGSKDVLYKMLSIAEILKRKYDVLVTNPPYMGSSGMNAVLSDFVKSRYPNSKADLFSCFIERGNKLVRKGGFNCMVTMQSWMFLSSFAKMRKNILENNRIVSLLHMDNNVMGIAFGTAATVLQCGISDDKYKGNYIKVSMNDIENNKPKEFPPSGRLFFAKKEDFDNIPGAPIAYWVESNIFEAFKKGIKIGQIGDAKQGMIPGNVKAFLRMWYEVDIDRIGFNHEQSEDICKYGYKWFPYNKGGAYRRWGGNIEHVIDMENDGYNIKYSGKNNNYRLREPELYFKEAITWSKVTNAAFSARYMPKGNLFDIAGCCVFSLNDNLLYTLGFLNSSVATYILDIISPTMNYEVEHIKSLPVIMNDEYKTEIEKLVEENIQLSWEDWNENETAMGFKRNPIVDQGIDLSAGISSYKEKCDERFKTIKKNEERLSDIFNKIYGMEGLIDSKVDSKNVTVKEFDERSVIKDLISYAVGCLFGRYSLDGEGVACAGKKWDEDKYVTLIPDKDAIIPFCDDEYFEDDIVSGFLHFMECAFGKDKLEDNLKIIATALGGKGTPREVIRSYFINDFYTDHLKKYQKKPIYWMFDSGNAGGFKCLVYMHRYREDTIARIRTDYIHELQSRYSTLLESLSNEITKTGNVEKKKRYEIIRLQEDELYSYEEKIHHLADQMLSIDLDEGVSNNYGLLKEVLADGV